jgi:glycosyltransferase involved in cell wall biosynthesis
LRILVVSDLFPPVAFGGYELECAALVQRLRAHHEVVVLTSDLRRREVAPDPAIRRELPFIGGGRRRAALRAPAAAVLAAGTTRRLIADLRPDLVYISNGLVIPQAAIAVAAGAEARLVCRFSELWFAQNFLTGDRFLRHLAPADEDPRRAAWGTVMRAVNRHPALRLAPRPHARGAISWASDALRQAAGPPAAVEPTLQRVIHPATSRNDQFAGLQRRPARRVTIAYVGRVTRAKGAEVACRSLAVLRERHGVDARLVYAGALVPAMRRRLTRLARRLGVDGQVELAGPLGAEALGALLAGAHAIVIPTIDFEAFPLASMEAALARVPIVASSVGGIPEALADGEHALLFPPGRADACAAALAATLGDPDATAARVARAFQRASGFTLDRYLDASEHLIADAA